MAWLTLPVRIHGPVSSYAISTYNDIRVGIEEDAGFTQVYFNGKNLIYPAPAQLLTYIVGSTHLLLQPSLIGGRPWWAEGNAVLYLSPTTSQWVYSTTLKAGYTPMEWQDDEDIWRGDAYYESAELPASYGGTATMTPRGSLKGGSPLSITLYDQPRWEGPSAGLGVYESRGGADGEKVIGNALWKEAVLKRSSRKDSNGKYTYTTDDNQVLAWDATHELYVLGTIDSMEGWHQTVDEPAVEGDYTLEFMKPVLSEAEGEDIVGVWDKWVQGDEKKKIHIAEAAVML